MIIKPVEDLDIGPVGQAPMNEIRLHISLGCAISNRV
jgi:hypothetical protein